VEKHPQEYHTLETAKQMADLLKDVANGRKLMNDFLENLKGQDSLASVRAVSWPRGVVDERACFPLTDHVC
jgi:hypothetical protein